MVQAYKVYRGGLDIDGISTPVMMTVAPAPTSGQKVMTLTVVADEWSVDLFARCISQEYADAVPEPGGH